MATQTAAKPDRFTGLPPGVRVGPLGRRFVAHLIDLVVPAVLVVVVATTGNGLQPVDVVALALLALWGLVVWWMFATRAAGPGMRLMKLQLVGFNDGRPIGWGRFLVRALVLGLLGVTVVGLLLMLFFLLRHPRYQGWHDLAGNAVVIRERMLAPRGRRPAAAGASTSRGSAVAESTSGSSAVPAETLQTPRPLTPPPPPAGIDPVAGSLPGAVLPLAPSGPEVGIAPVAPGVVAAGSVPAVAEPAEAERPAPEPAAPRSSGPPPASPPAPQRWAAVLDDGREVPVTGLVLLGRNPQPRPGEETAELVKVADETRTVSKSHLALDLTADGLIVVDRGSTNGSRVTTVDGVTTVCDPEKPVLAAPDSVVSMGDHWLTIRQS